MTTFDRMPNTQELVNYITSKESAPLLLNEEAGHAIIAFGDKASAMMQGGTAIVPVSNERKLFVAWSNEAPIFGLKWYRFVVVVDYNNDEPTSHYYYVHGESLNICYGGEVRPLEVWARPQDGDIFDAKKTDDEAAMHFSIVYDDDWKANPRKFAEDVLSFYEQLVAPYLDRSGLRIEIEEGEVEPEEIDDYVTTRS